MVQFEPASDYVVSLASLSVGIADLLGYAHHVIPATRQRWRTARNYGPSDQASQARSPSGECRRFRGVDGAGITRAGCVRTGCGCPAARFRACGSAVALR
ncbi:MAG TPA: hypothetical protein VHV82_12155 [Sporichthyaceae bacterium]|nr:hypothetical protein [Sporichthyaceae bacterium]